MIFIVLVCHVCHVSLFYRNPGQIIPYQESPVAGPGLIQTDRKTIEKSLICEECAYDLSSIRRVGSVIYSGLVVQ